MPFNDSAKNTMLDALDETLTQITHVAVLTSAVDPGTGTNSAGTEATGGSPAYARIAVTWANASAGTKANSNSMTFDVPAGTYAYFGLFNASTGNTSNYKGYIPFGGATALKGVAYTDAIANDQFLSVSHGMSDGDRVQIFNVWAETFPTGPTEGVLYFVVSSAANSFKVSTTLGGSAVDVSALGTSEIYWQRVVPEVFASQGQITVAASALVLDATAF